jgi:hypothetical protein
MADLTLLHQYTADMAGDIEYPDSYGTGCRA